MSKVKKKHICSCGEEFNHGIGLRKHQRQTGHKGSSVVEVAEDEGEKEAAPPRAEPAQAPPPKATETPPPPPPPPKVTEAPPPAPPPVEPPPPPPPAAAPSVAATTPAEFKSESAAPEPGRDYQDNDDDSERTVAINRAMSVLQQRGNLQPPPAPSAGHEPSALAHNRQKLSLISKGLTIVAQHRAKTAGIQLKQSAQYSASVFSEALKIVFAILLLISVPLTLYWWWSSGQKKPSSANSSASSIAFTQNEATVARNAVLKYLDLLAKGQANEAYQQLSAGWQSEASLSSFKEALSNITDIRWAIDSQKLINNESAEVNLVLAFVEGSRPKKFQGKFLLLQSDGEWKIDRLDLSPAKNNKT